jgi:hypothetical protein
MESTDDAVATAEPQDAQLGLTDALQGAKDAASPSAPLREDEVQNAVAFLTNPKVVVRFSRLWPQCCDAVFAPPAVS